MFAYIRDNKVVNEYISSSYQECKEEMLDGDKLNTMLTGLYYDIESSNYLVCDVEGNIYRENTLIKSSKGLSISTISILSKTIFICLYSDGSIDIIHESDKVYQCANVYGPGSISKISEIFNSENCTLAGTDDWNDNVDSLVMVTTEKTVATLVILTNVDGIFKDFSLKIMNDDIMKNVIDAREVNKVLYTVDEHGILWTSSFGCGNTLNYNELKRDVFGSRIITLSATGNINSLICLLESGEAFECERVTDNTFLKRTVRRSRQQTEELDIRSFHWNRIPFDNKFSTACWLQKAFVGRKIMLGVDEDGNVITTYSQIRNEIGTPWTTKKILGQNCIISDATSNNKRFKGTKSAN